jgi:integrase
MEFSRVQLLEAQRSVDREKPIAAGVERYLRASQAANTTRAYRSDWEQFQAFCQETEQDALPASPETVATYVAGLALGGRKTWTILRRLSGISVAHQAAGHPSPTRSVLVRKTVAGIKRTQGMDERQATPLMPRELRAIIRALPLDTLAGKRDRAILLLGFYGALRRSEIAALEVADITEVEQGLRVRIGRSKSDQVGAGREVGVPKRRRDEFCPVAAVTDWLSRSGLGTGPLFRSVTKHGELGLGPLSGQAVAAIVVRSAARSGLIDADYSGHSLRAGFATAAAEGGAPERAIMAQTGHRSVQMVRKYIRSGSLFRENAADFIRL